MKYVNKLLISCIIYSCSLIMFFNILYYLMFEFNNIYKSGIVFLDLFHLYKGFLYVILYYVFIFELV